jgi:succinate dehydrogenase/fumarate reductase iron-sulfur protein
MRVLEALDYIVEELGESLAYRWFCGVKKCGACGMVVNGRPVLACWEPVEPEIVIEPLPHFPLIRDLVVDRDRYTRDLLALDPFLRRSQPYPGFPEFLTGTAMEGTAEMMHCVECMLCTSVCPAYDGASPFVGPAPLVQLARFALDPRDAGDRARLAAMVGTIRDCVNCYQCVEVCPNNVNVLEHAIDALRRQIVREGIGDVAHHNVAFRELFIEQGIVNPSTLMARSQGWKLLREIPFAIRLWLRGRLSLGKVLKGLLKLERLRSQRELIALEDAIRSLTLGGKQ